MELMQHQKEGLQQLESFNRCALYWDMGLGKTFAGAEKMNQLNKRINLIICQKSKINDWIEHFFQNYNEDFFRFDLTDKNGMVKFFDFISLDLPCVGIINYELAWRRKELLKLHDFTLMLDESSLIQNDTAKQSKFVLKLDPANVILLSGTPTGGKYENLWSQAKLLGWDISKKLYNSTYVNWTDLNLANGAKIKVVDKRNPYKNIERLKRKFREYGANFIKTEDVLTLPEQTFIEVKVDKSKEYVQFNRDSIISVFSPIRGGLMSTTDPNYNGEIELVGNTSLTKMLYLRQLCGMYSEEKIQAFWDIVQSTNDRLVVFYNFTDELNQMLNCFHGERPISIVNGNGKNLLNYEHYDNSVTFVQYQAGAMGLNLQKANKIIYFTLPLSSELFEQSKKRIHRIGQKNNCFYYIMQVKGSIEGKIYEALKMRQDYTERLFEEGV